MKYVLMTAALTVAAASCGYRLSSDKRPGVYCPKDYQNEAGSMYGCWSCGPKPRVDIGLAKDMGWWTVTDECRLRSSRREAIKGGLLVIKDDNGGDLPAEFFYTGETTSYLEAGGEKLACERRPTEYAN